MHEGEMKYGPSLF